MNMFKPVRAKSSQEYFDNLSPERREMMDFLDKFIKTNAPSLLPNFLYNMPGYGSFEYKNSKKQILNWPTIAMASQKNYISLYICALYNGGYLAEFYKKDLGKVNVGKSCICFKKVEDLNLDALKKVIKMVEKSPGLVLET